MLLGLVWLDASDELFKNATRLMSRMAGGGDETTVKPELEVPKAGSITDIIIIKSNVSRNTQKM